MANNTPNDSFNMLEGLELRTNAEVEAYNTVEIQELLSRINNLETDNHLLRENLSDAMLSLQVENIGWMSVLGGGGMDASTGVSLTELKEISDKCRQYGSFTDLIKRGLGLRASYVWSKGILVDAPDGEKKEKNDKPTRGGRKKVWKSFLENNFDLLMDAEGQQEIERLAGTDGNVLFAVPIKNPGSSRMMIFGIADIDSVIFNPNKQDDIWAYRRAWSKTNLETGKVTTEREWYVTDRWDESVAPIKDFIGEGAERFPVSRSHVIVDVRVNRMKGWAFGIPDVSAGLPYYREYNNFMKYGSDVAEAMSKIVFKVLNRSAGGAGKANVSINRPGIGASAIALGEGQDVQALNTAGKGYDFDSGRSLAARLAASLEVSVIHLLSDPGAAGSSYGSAQNLDMPTKRAMVLRQRTWQDAFRRIFNIVAPSDNIKVEFPPLDDADPYREAQTRTMDWLTGLIHEDEMRQRILEETKMKSIHKSPPENVLLPNNADSWQRADIDPQQDPNIDSSKNSEGTGRVEAASPDQGRNTGAGSTSYKDMRQDVLSQSLVQGQIAALEEKMDSMMHEMMRQMRETFQNRNN